MTEHTTPAGRLGTVHRFPVKSLVGEQVAEARIEPRGLAGDRAWAVVDEDGRLGSGKSSRRFRRMAGLLDLTAAYDGGVPVITFPDGARVRGDDPSVHAALSAHVGRPVTLRREDTVPHFDEGPLHLVTTSALARAGELLGAPVDVRRLRANLVVDTGTAPAFDEREWTGREVLVGDEVVLRVREPMVRCVMVDLPQAGLPPGPDGLLATLGRENDTCLGVVVDVVVPGTVRAGDTVRTRAAADRGTMVP
jgi:uncharacterized protein YcbX